jgi:hypothetical protein
MNRASTHSGRFAATSPIEGEEIHNKTARAFAQAV